VEQQPSNQQILAWLAEIGGEENKLDAAAKREEDLYFQQYDLEVPEGHRVVRLGTAPGDVDQALETAAPGDTIGVEVRPAKDTRDWQERADDREKWIRALLALWRTPDDFVRQLLWGILVQRKRWLRVSYSPPPQDEPPTPFRNESWDSFDQRTQEWQDRRAAWVPLEVEITPRGSIFGRETSNGQLLYCFEQYSRTIADLTYWYPPDRFPAVSRIIRGRSFNDYVSFTSFFSKDWRASYVDLQPILPSAQGSARDTRGVVRNEYSFIPFIPCYFRKLPVAEPDRQYRGFLSNAVDDYISESLLASQYLTIIARAAWPVVLTRFLDNRKFVQRPGWQFPLRPGEAVEAFNGQAPVPEVGQAWDRIRAAIRQNALGASAGNMPPGVRSAEALSMMQGPDRNKIAPALVSLQQALETAVTMALKIIEHLHQQPVTLPIAEKAKNDTGRSLQVVTLKPEDIRGYYDCHISFGPAFGMDVLNRAQALNALVKDHFIARERAWRNVPELVESQEDAFQELIEEAADNHPLMVQANVMKRLSLYDPQIFAWMMQVGAFNGPNQGAGPRPGGPPGGPGGPPPPAGQPGPSPPGAVPGGAPPPPPRGGNQIGRALPGASPVVPMR
jgi:hypothetical protein